MLVSFWFWRRQPETLSAENKKIFYEKRIYKEFKELIKFKRTIGFTIISGFITGSLYGLPEQFAANIPESIQSRREVSFHFRWTCYIHWSRCLLNGILVIKYGMEKLITSA
jgi:DHA1 family bicyclomycin/chloramphenicol resistance-like MFS transporter